MLQKKNEPGSIFERTGPSLWRINRGLGVILQGGRFVFPPAGRAGARWVSREGGKTMVGHIGSGKKAERSQWTGYQLVQLHGRGRYNGSKGGETGGNLPNKDRHKC